MPARELYSVCFAVPKLKENLILLVYTETLHTERQPPVENNDETDTQRRPEIDI